MVNKFLLPSANILNIIERKMTLITDIGMTKWDLLSIVVEYLEYNSQHNGCTDVFKYLDENWLLNVDVAPRIGRFVEIVLSDLEVFCPELFDVMKRTDNLMIVYYDKHVFILEKSNV